MAPKRISRLKRLIEISSFKLRERDRVLKNFSKKIGLLGFGVVDQRKDEGDSLIRGFTTSLTHHDSQYAVGTYNGFDIRVVNRFDNLRLTSLAGREQIWTILEIQLAKREPHVCLVPTGSKGGEYARLFATLPHLLPLNSMLKLRNHSPEFHGHYQILARPSHEREIEEIFTSPIMVGIGTKLWPHGIEFNLDKLFIYITQDKLTEAMLEEALTAGLWLAETISEPII